MVLFLVDTLGLVLGACVYILINGHRFILQLSTKPHSLNLFTTVFLNVTNTTYLHHNNATVEHVTSRHLASLNKGRHHHYFVASGDFLQRMTNVGW